jgi:hypothetical protein
MAWSYVVPALIAPGAAVAIPAPVFADYFGARANASHHGFTVSVQQPRVF